VNASKTAIMFKDCAKYTMQDFFPDIVYQVNTA